MRRDFAHGDDLHPSPTGGTIRSTLDGGPEQGRLEFLKPNSMVLHLPIPGRRLLLQVHCVPLSQNETRMMVVTGRDFGRYNPLLRLFDQTNRIIVAEDRAVVESSDPAEIPASAGTLGGQRPPHPGLPSLLLRRASPIRPEPADPDPHPSPDR